MSPKNQNKNYSILKLLREQKKSNDYFEIMLSNLTLEEIICLKLELTYKNIGVALYGFPLWKNSPKIIRDALLKYALSISSSKSMAARVLGVKSQVLHDLLKLYNIKDIKQYNIKETQNANN